MPNWCSCCLQVTGPSLDYFYDKMRDKSRLSFDDFHPVPAELANVLSGCTTIDGVAYNQWRECVVDPLVTQAQFDDMGFLDRDKVAHTRKGITPDDEARLVLQYGAASALDWQRRHWGVKWDACEVEIDHIDDQSMEARFDTPWCPPAEWLEKVSEDFPTLQFVLAFAEGGFGFWGVSVYKAGVEIEHSYREGSFWKPGGTREDDDDVQLVPDVAEHLARYGLHTGG